MRLLCFGFRKTKPFPLLLEAQKFVIHPLLAMKKVFFVVVVCGVLMVAFGDRSTLVNGLGWFALVIGGIGTLAVPVAPATEGMSETASDEPDWDV
jgi:hypothetical protein